MNSDLPVYLFLIAVALLPVFVKIFMIILNWVNKKLEAKFNKKR